MPIVPYVLELISMKIACRPNNLFAQSIKQQAAQKGSWVTQPLPFSVIKIVTLPPPNVIGTSHLIENKK